MCETGFDLIESQFNGVASDCDPIASDKLIDTAAPIDPSHLCRAVSSSEVAKLRRKRSPQSSSGGLETELGAVSQGEVDVAGEVSSSSVAVERGVL